MPGRLYTAGQLIAVQFLREVYPIARQKRVEQVLAMEMQRVPEKVRKNFIEEYCKHWESQIPVNPKEQITIPRPAGSRLTVDKVAEYAMRELEPYEGRTACFERSGTNSPAWANHPHKPKSPLVVDWQRGERELADMRRKFPGVFRTPDAVTLPDSNMGYYISGR